MVESHGVMLDGHDEVIASVRCGIDDMSREHHGAFEHYGACAAERTRPHTKPCQFVAASSCAVAADVSDSLAQARLSARHQREYGQNRDIVGAVYGRRDFVDDLTG